MIQHKTAIFKERSQMHYFSRVYLRCVTARAQWSSHLMASLTLPVFSGEHLTVRRPSVCPIDWWQQQRAAGLPSSGAGDRYQSVAAGAAYWLLMDICRQSRLQQASGQRHAVIWRPRVNSRDRGIMRLCARIISRIIGDLPHNWANPA